MIRATFAAAPRRPLVLAAKADRPAGRLDPGRGGAVPARADRGAVADRGRRFRPRCRRAVAFGLLCAYAAAALAIERASSPAATPEPQRT
jgi:hypothetical protein